jgi:hypothetical protein
MNKPFALPFAALLLATLTLSVPASAREAKGLVYVTAQVVHTAKVDVEVLPTVKPAAAKAVQGGTEWKVPLQVSAGSSSTAPAPKPGATYQVKDCQGAQAERSDGELKVFVPQGTTCAPVVVATAYPDGAPPEAERL